VVLLPKQNRFDCSQTETRIRDQPPDRINRADRGTQPSEINIETNDSMKLFARLNVVVLLAISALLFVAWNLPSYHPITRAKKVWNRQKTEIVVFGDSWSTNRLDLPETPSPAPAKKKLWVDILCSEVCCV
jgi:hypothetical protein